MFREQEWLRMNLLALHCFGEKRKADMYYKELRLKKSKSKNWFWRVEKCMGALKERK